jgi:transcriptional regulator with PAS, ATPase and Fis domain
MNDITRLLQDDTLARILMDSVPFGLFIVDGDGRVMAVNNMLERVLGVTEQTIVGKGSGETLGCLHASETPEGCGSGEYCKDCECRKLALTAISQNQKRNANVYFQLIIDGQVRDLTLLVSAVPFTFNNKRFAVLIITDITRLSSMSPPDTYNGFRGIVGRDKKMQELFDTIRQVARTDAPVLIQGETGTGKELVALAIHKESPRARKHFVPINCGALPEGLLETELFGHVKGAFTGAIREKKGRFELADGGTIFLDEVGELSPATQVKLLRVLQDGCFERVGSERTVRVDVRVISATNKNLEEEVSAGRFRLDLYYRLCVMPIMLPPLRDRKMDIPLLSKHFLEHYPEESLGKRLTLSPMALSIFMYHTWPGNVRELQNVLQFASVKCQGHVIEPRHIPSNLQRSKIEPSTVRRREPKLQPIAVAEALKKASDNKRHAAKILGVSRSTLYRFFARQENNSADS